MSVTTAGTRPDINSRMNGLGMGMNEGVFALFLGSEAKIIRKKIGLGLKRIYGCGILVA